MHPNASHDARRPGKSWHCSNNKPDEFSRSSATKVANKDPVLMLCHAAIVISQLEWVEADPSGIDQTYTY